MPYTPIVSEGGLLPTDILDAIAAGELPGQRPEDFGLERTRNLSDRISAAWQAARGQWALFQSYLADLPPSETATSETREQWVLPLLRVLGYQLARNRSAYLVQSRTYAISHRAGEADDTPPVHIESIRNSLDARPPSGRPRLSPHALMQEYLNNTEQLWGIVTNGERLRLLRDSSRFTRPTYVEFDLRSILEGEQFSAFALLYRLLHRSRMPVGADDASACLLEKYHQQAVDAGGRVRDGLRDGVESALKLLGDGLLRHPANTALRRKLGIADGTRMAQMPQIDTDQPEQNDQNKNQNQIRENPSDPRHPRAIEPIELTPLEYYRQLLRLVYRLLFLMVAEERGLIAAGAHHKGTEAQRPDEEEEDFETLRLRASVVPAGTALRIYYDHYSVGRLRRMAEASGTGRGPYTDLWAGLLTTFRLLEGSDEIAPRRLGLAPLDGDLFSDASCAALTTHTHLTNRALLAAVRALSLYREKESKILRRVNYGGLDVEELGSVYESLLDFRPVIIADGTRMAQIGQMSADSTHHMSDLRPSVPSAPSASYHFNLVTGTERKTTGSYYTRPELVQELIKSALNPVLDERLSRVDRTRIAQTGRMSADSTHQKSDPRPSVPSAPSASYRSAEDAILSIRVVDPACGSGAFLLAAARRLGRELARVRAGEDQPSPTQFRHAVRDVIRRCIFGVDLNPLAVDLCKLALWIEGHAAGLPLSFLDHHIRQGNSLVGATRALVEQGIPDDAYKAVTGDDKATASSVKKRNKQERELYLKQRLVQQDLFTAPSHTDADMAEAMRALDQADDTSVAAVRARAARYAALRHQSDSERATFDLWTAAFFQPLTPTNARYVPTTKDLIDFNPTGEQALMAAPIAADVGFFHWELEFPTTNGSELANGGHSFIRAQFDVVLGNPPWERIKLQEQEHFVDVSEIALAANKSAREKMIAVWRNGDERQRARIAEFDAAKYRAEAESRFVRASERFPLTAVGDVNTYALFAEQFRTLLSPAGRAGIIVPTGIAMDDTTKAFFGDLSTRQQLVSLYDFENREKIFAEVDSRYKFSLLTVGVTREPTQFIFFAANVTQLTDKQRVFTLTPEEITLINPNTRTAPVFRTRQDAELTKKIYRRAPVLINERTEANPWGISFLRMLDMSNDSHLFQSAPGEGLLPLYEGKMVQAFNHRAASVVTNINNLKRPGQPDETTEAQLQDSRFQVNPQYTITQENLLEKLGGQKCQSGFIAYKSVSSVTNERSMIAAWLPPVAVAHSMNLILPDTKITSQISLLSVLNSVVLDYVIRQKMGGVNLSFFIVNQLPVLPPSAFSPQHSAYIIPRVVELVYTAWDIKAFAEDVWGEADNELRAELWNRWEACKAQHYAENPARAAEIYNNLSPQPSALSPQPFALPPFIWNDTRRAQARAELDARIAKLYGLTRDELRYILDPADVYGPDFPGETFRVLKEKETKLYGEYRTRRLVLEAWDREEGRNE